MDKVEKIIWTQDGIDSLEDIVSETLPITGEPNSGLEGIAYNPNTGGLYVLNEKNPYKC